MVLTSSRRWKSDTFAHRGPRNAGRASKGCSEARKVVQLAWGREGEVRKSEQ